MKTHGQITATLPASPEAHFTATEHGRRASRIIELVGAAGFLAIDSLAEHFGVTPQTIRRDVNQLCDRGLLRRRHGGVELPVSGENLAYLARRVLNLDAKRCIARRLALDVPDRASLFFGIGTTPEICAQALLGHSQLRVMTHNLSVALVLCGNPTFDLTVAGGRIRNADRDVVAAEAHAFFERYSVDIGVFGVGGVAEDGTLLDFSPDEVTMRRALMRHCRQRYLVLDHSKFGREATVRGGHLCDATAIYTDRPVPGGVAEMLAEAGTRLIVCREGQSASPGFPCSIPNQGE
jgi:DeoR family glycerol-3-phosphate regulon repressor